MMYFVNLSDSKITLCLKQNPFNEKKKKDRHELRIKKA